MAFADSIRGFETGIAARLRGALGRAHTHFTRLRTYKRTYNELSKLSDRELDDLGIIRAQIAEVSRGSVYGR